MDRVTMDDRVYAVAWIAYRCWHIAQHLKSPANREINASYVARELGISRRYANMVLNEAYERGLLMRTWYRYRSNAIAYKYTTNVFEEWLASFRDERGYSPIRCYNKCISKGGV